MSDHSASGTEAVGKGAEASTATSGATYKESMKLAGQASGLDNIKSMSDLQAKAPQLYKYMMQSIAQNICIQWKQQQDRLKEEWKKFANNSN